MKCRVEASINSGSATIRRYGRAIVLFALPIMVFGGSVFSVAAQDDYGNKSKPSPTPKKPTPRRPAKPSAPRFSPRDPNIELVRIRSGSFDMGGEYSNEQPVHRVRIAYDFEMGKYEVTQAQWKAVMGNNPSSFKGDSLPVESVSWDDAMKFIRKLNEMDLAGEGYEFSLPTEAEWEYACRAGTTTEFAFGDTITPDQVNYNGNYPYGGAAKGLYRERTTPVGSLGWKNEFGLYDMHGNVWEWCLDCYKDNYKEAPADGSAFGANKSDCAQRVVRGGSWYLYAFFCRSAFRYRIAPDSASNIVGFRVVRVPRTRR